MSSHIQEDYPLVGNYGSRGKSPLFWIGAAVFVCWNILIFVLAVVAISKANNIDEPELPAPPVFVQSVSSVADSTIPEGAPVSVLANGKLKAGAGTSIYMKTQPHAQLGAGAYNLKVARFIDDQTTDTVIIVWANNTATYAMVGKVSLNSRVISGYGKPVLLDMIDDKDFDDVITLQGNHFVIVTPTNVIAGSISDMDITAIQTFNYPKNASYSDVHIIPLLPQNFIVSFTIKYNIENGINNMGFMAGSIIWNVASQKPTLTWLVTDPMQFNTSSSMHDIFALDSASFVFAYSQVGAGLGGAPYLACAMGRLTSNKNVYSLSLGKPTTYVGVLPQFYISATGLDSKTGVVVVVDKADEFSLKAILVHEAENAIDGLRFGSHRVLNSGVTDNSYTNQLKSVPFISTVTLSNNKFAAAYADFTNQGRLTTVIVSIDQATLLHPSASYVIGDPVTADELKDNYSVNTAPLSIQSTGQVGYLIIDRQNAPAANESTNVALVEILNKPFGIAAHHVEAGKTLKVNVNGITNYGKQFGKVLKPGHMYFAKTNNNGLVEGPLVGSLDETQQYLTDDDGTIVSIDSVVGFAVSETELFVQVKP